MKARLLIELAVATMMAVTITGCSKGGSSASSSATSASSAVTTSTTSKKSAAPSVVPVVDTTALAVSPASAATSPSVSAAPPVNAATAGAITGTVKLDGETPIFPRIFMIAWPSCVLMHPGNLYPPVVIAGKDGALANVLVYVKSGLRHRSYTPPKTPVVLDQKGCMYNPRVVALMTDQPLWIKNSDQTEHEVHIAAQHNPQWSTTQPAGSPPAKISFQHPEFAMPVLCKVHPWMRAYAFVFDNPYYAVTSSKGTFDLKNLPPGTYTIEAWQEYYGVQDRKITIAPHQTKSVSFVFRPKASKS